MSDKTDKSKCLSLSYWRKANERDLGIYFLN